MYNMDTCHDGILLSFTVFKNIFNKSILAALHMKKTIQSLKTYNQSNIEQLGMYSNIRT